MERSRATRGPAGKTRTLGVVVLAALALILALAGPAAAAPSEPTLALDELQARLEAGPVTGYFLTVDEGSHMASVPMRVLSIAGGAGPDGALIMFSADMTDPLMARIGTIASGMSGSPLFVDDPGGDLLIGALSYGDVFTLDGLALATPIQYMSAVEARLGSATVPPVSLARTVRLSEPVRVPGDGVITGVRVVRTAQAARTAREPGVAVFAPLSAVQLGGLPVKGRAYAALAAELERRGHTVIRGFGTGPGGWDPGFTAPLAGGSALAAMYTRGDLWAGALGTVTYVTEDRLVAFGHYMDWIGPTSLYLCNAQIDGIWADSMAAYKLGTPGAVRGIISQDRGSGIAGLVGEGPAEMPVTSSVTAELETATEAAGTTWMTAKWAGDSFGVYLAAAAVTAPAYRTADRSFMPGSAETETTVVVSDGSQEYTVHRVNLWDDPYDILWTMSNDVSEILDMLVNGDTYGTAHATIVSVDSRATIRASRMSAAITDVSVAAPLRTGSNVVTVWLQAYGDPDPVAVPVTLEIPPDTPLEGVLSAQRAGGEVPEDGEEEPGGGGTAPGQTVADVVADLNARPANDVIEVTFSPASIEPVPVGGDVLAADGSQSVTATASSGYVVSGSAAKTTASLTLRARPAKVRRGERTTLTGRLFAAPGDTSVRVYRRYRGEGTYVQVATVPVSVIDGVARFSYRTPRLKKAAVFRVEWDGDVATLAAKASVAVGLRR